MPSTADLRSYVNFNTAEWKYLKRWLEAEREDKVKALVTAKNHDDSQMHRGAINLIDKLLGAEKTDA